jgi:Restriction endonuclease EcoRV
VPDVLTLAAWLREQCASYAFDVAGIFNRPGEDCWPLSAASMDDLETQLIDRGHLLPLPREPAALANVLEVLVADFLLDAAAQVEGLEWQRGTERGYPDIEMFGPALGGQYWAVDVKVARRAIVKRGTPTRTNSRITLYTGNTYFKHPDLAWPGTFRPFGDYKGHLDVILLYTLDPATRGRATDLELIVQEPWRLASKQRSSTTREYIGGVMEIDRLRRGSGDFATADEFYAYWRNYPFRLSQGIQNTLTRLVKKQRDELLRLRHAQQGDSG